jgi:20S proteasome alpha/beta subunit
MIAPKPRPLLLKRLPERKPRMTFILGMKCEDGIVLCSDSLEGDGYNKSYVEKLHRFTGAQARWGIAWGCAGYSSIIKRFDDKMMEVIKNEAPEYDRYKLEQLFEIVMKKMRKDYPDERLSLVATIWGINDQNIHEARLYSIYETSYCLSAEDRFACAGMDVSLARFFLGSLYRKYLNVYEAEQVAIFITSVMKEKADGVGGPTQLISHTVDGETDWFKSDPNSIAHAETTKYVIDEVEGSIMTFFWHRSNHRFRSGKDGSDKCHMGEKDE